MKTLLGLSCLFMLPGLLSAESGIEAKYRRAERAYERREWDEAIRIVSDVVKHAPHDAAALMLRAAAYDQKRDYAKSILDYDRLLALHPHRSVLYLRRGSARFGNGDIAGSIEDFDKQIELDPAAEASHWQRGLSYYYAGRFEDGARQFEMGKVRYASDVENVVWRFACQAKAAGVDTALREILALQGTDPRIPMMVVHDLFRGKATVQDVLRAAKQAERPVDRQRQLFYGHLYVGLYHAAYGHAGEERKHILEAEKYKISHYMWDVAHVHAQKLRQQTGAEEET